jgi:predicted nucleic acid-binding protein
MNVFFDTSALVKYFREEEGTRQVTALIQNPQNTLWIMELARIEFISALFRHYRTGGLSKAQLAIALEGFDQEYPRFQVEPLGRVLASEAERLVRKYGQTEGLRTLDALHLAAFTLIAEQDWLFVAADNTLCHVVRKENHRAYHPLTDHLPGLVENESEAD